MITPFDIVDCIKNRYYKRLDKLRMCIDNELKLGFIRPIEEFIPYYDIKELKVVIEEYKKAGWSINWVDEIEDDKSHKILFFYNIPPVFEVGMGDKAILLVRIY